MKLTFEISLCAQSVFNLSLHSCLGGFLQCKAGNQRCSNISPAQVLLFFLSCLLRRWSSLFFLQKGRKANLEKKSACMSSALTWPWCPVLARWQFIGREWVRQCYSRQLKSRGKKKMGDLNLLQSSACFPPPLVLPYSSRGNIG